MHLTSELSCWLKNIYPVAATTSKSNYVLLISWLVCMIDRNIFFIYKGLVPNYTVRKMKLLSIRCCSDYNVN